jgi:hypothetical protein
MYPNKPGFGSNQSASGQPIGMPKLSPNYLPQMGPSDEHMKRYGALETQAEVPIPKSKAEEYFDLLAQDIQERAAQAKEEGDINKYLAIMQAGFGMMGGTSPYALTNIGKGAEQGISTYGALRKQSLDTLKDIGASRLGLAKYKAAEEGAAETRQLNKTIRESGLGQQKSEFERKKSEDILRHQEFAQKQIAIAKDDYRQYVAMKEAQLLKDYPLGAMDPKYVKAKESLFANDPVFKQLQMEAFPKLTNVSPSTAVGVKQYNPKTGEVE